MRRGVVVKVFMLMLTTINTSTLFAQNQPNDVASATTNFEEWFYDSLKEKAIENYDKAIINLEKCLEKQPQSAIINHELGKNYFLWKQYTTAEKYFISATQIDAKNKWYWIDLYEVYYQTKNFPKGIEILQKVIPLDKNYRDDLLSLYMYTRQFEKALVLLNELEDTDGKTERRNQYRVEINMQTRNSTSYSDLENALDKNPQNEENYLSLIQRYTDNNQESKAIEMAQKLEKNIPNSDWAQVFLFKYYLENNNISKAVQAIDKVFGSSKMDKKVKYKMYNQFLLFSFKNQNLEKELDKYTQYFANDAEINVYKEIGKFYYKKKNWELAIKNLELSFKKSNSDFETNVFLLASYEEVKSLEKMFAIGNELIDLFPNQPEYYFFAGKGAHLLKNLKKSNDLLQTGLDYVVENIALEKDFLTELIQVSNELGNATQASSYQARLNKLK
ncbi:MAG: hypothetical protein QM535_01105 [Limnohabitans sp.]|nr:hypothetical protein [Limnohabitans sp.]